MCFIAVPITAIAEQITVTETFNNQQINEDIQFLYGGNDTTVSASTTQDPECASTTNAGTIGIEDLDCFGGIYFGTDRFQLGIRASADTLTIAFPNSDSKAITEVGFVYNARETTGTGTVYFDNDETQTINFIDQQSETNQSTSITITAPTGTTINEIQVAGVSSGTDWWLIDSVYYKYDNISTTTTSSSTTTTSTTSTTTTTTTTVPPTTTTTTVPPTTTTSTTTTTTTTTINPLDVERNNNQAETGLRETNQERQDREDKEYAEQLAREEAQRQAELEAEEERLRLEEEARVEAELEAQRLIEEELERLRIEEEERIQAELEELMRIEAEEEAEILLELEEAIDLEQIGLEIIVECPEEEVDCVEPTEEEIQLIKAELQEFIDVIQELEELDLEEEY